MCKLSTSIFGQCFWYFNQYIAMFHVKHYYEVKKLIFKNIMLLKFSVWYILKYYDFGFKRYFNLMILTVCSTLCAPSIHKTWEIRPIRTTFSCFVDPKGHTFVCEHETYDLLTLVSYYYTTNFNLYKILISMIYTYCNMYI